MIDFWIDRFPLCPSVNESLTIARGRLIHTNAVRRFYQNVDIFKLEFRSEVFKWSTRVGEYLTQNPGSALKVDAYHCFHHSRIWTKDGKPKQLDANNRIKSCLDGLVKLFGVDDKYFFAGNCEKVTCAPSEYECTILHIYAFEPRTRDNIVELMKFKAG